VQLFELLRDAVPALVDPGTTAEWEMQLDDVVTGRTDYRRVIDAIAAEAEKLIAVLQRREGTMVDLQAASFKAKRSKRRWRKNSCSAKGDEKAAPARKSTTTKLKRTQKKKGVATSKASAKLNGKRAAPTARMIAYAESLAKSRKMPLPAGYDTDFQTCRQFLDQHGGRS
jgi:DNA topoisomerase-3